MSREIQRTEDNNTYSDDKLYTGLECAQWLPGFVDDEPGGMEFGTLVHEKGDPPNLMRVCNGIRPYIATAEHWTGVESIDIMRA